MKIRIYILVALVTSAVSHPRDISNFYYARIFPGEPRFEKPWLAEGFIRLMGSSSDHGYDIDGKQQPLFDIFGKHNPRTWAHEIPDLDPANNSIDQLLSDISNLDSRQAPNLTADGELQVIQVDMQYTQNFDHGIFATVHMPIRDIDISKVRVTPTDASNNGTYTQFLEQFDTILHRFGYQQRSQEQSDLGDISLSIGYTCNYENTEAIDFIDTTIQAGVLTPSGKKVDPRTVFDVPHGFNERTGFMLHYTNAFGIYDWLTFGWYAHAIIFAPIVMKQRIHTTRDGSGWIAPRSVNLHISDGHLWNVGMYTKADHFVQGFSILFGYSYDRKEASCAQPVNADATPDIDISNNPRLCGWKKHTFHWSTSYDFAHCDRPYAPELTIFCNHIIDGNQVFESSAGGMSLGCNITFSF